MEHLQSNIFVAGQRLNDLTGYSGIEALKDKITALETAVQDAQAAVRTARTHYKTVVADRASTQREVTTLLARKDSWTPLDLERFTGLYRSDHSNEQAVQTAATSLAETERRAEHLASKLSSSILSRYHEEQIWSDKIRRMSTWGTWGLMGVNVLLFLIFQLGFEPWRRARLVRGFEEKVKEALDKEKISLHTSGGMTGVASGEALDVQGLVAAAAQETAQDSQKTGEESETGTDVIASVLAKEGSDSNGDVASEASEVAAPQEPTAPAKVEHDINNALLYLRSLGKPETWENWRLAIEDLFSGRTVSLRKQDVTVIALEGAATGAACAGLLVALLLKRN